MRQKLNMTAVWLGGFPLSREGKLTCDEQGRINGLREKSQQIDVDGDVLEKIPLWGFDGSSTGQAEGKRSDLRLRPVRVYPDPFRGKGNIIVLCEVDDIDGKPHISNTRSWLREVVGGVADQKPLCGMEQEYFFYKDGRPLGWPKSGMPAPNQGQFYCGVGAANVAGRHYVELHQHLCREAGILHCGINSEVALGQWEFQIGAANPLKVADDLWIARYLLELITEEAGIEVNYHPKPLSTIRGAEEWNGSGLHTNFSCELTRQGKEGVNETIRRLRANYEECLKVFGFLNDLRLTGKAETASIDECTSGEYDRGASIRIPLAAMDILNANNRENFNRLYVEWRTVAAPADPYLVLGAIVQAACTGKTVLPASIPLYDCREAMQQRVEAIQRRL